MTEPTASRLAVGEGAARRELAVLARAGDAPGVLWLGGFKSDMTGSKAAALDAWAAAAGRAATRFDYAGHGASSGRFEDGTISLWLDDARAVFERATTGDQILVGSSMGGWIALLLCRAELAAARAEGRPSRVRGLVLIAPAPDFTEALMWARFPEEARRAITEKGLLAVPSQYSPEPTIITRALIEDGRRHCLMGGPIETGCPVHVVQGVADPDVPWRHAVDLVTCLSGEDTVLTLIKDGDHRLSRPEDIRRILAAVDGLCGPAEAVPSPVAGLP